MTELARGRVLIAGAGIGGLTAAIALRHSGFDVAVFERAPVIRPVGAGIALAANAILGLRRLGIADRVVAVGQPVRGLAIKEASGHEITSSDLTRLEEALGAPTLTFHRAELHEALLGALGPEVVRLGAAVNSFQHEDGGVRIHLDDGATHEGEALIGADGLHSAVRRQLVGDTPLRYWGQTSWRGVTSPGEFLPQGSTSESWGPGRRFGLVSLTGGRVYWFAVEESPPGEKDEPGQTRAYLHSAFAGWHEPISAVLDATSEEDILRTDIQDRDPLPRWTKGRVTLLGDAAHPMTPNLGQGACQAIVDAVVLAEEIGKDTDTAAALARYEARRISRTRDIVLRSRAAGAMAHWRNPLARFARNTALKTLRPAFLSQMKKFLAGDGMTE
jgi:2-polyprenyl-6-methoxyphenol hydroxylase-like FAD-dependent oxidoreductase